MSIIPLKTMLEAGVHFGHQTKRWNPKMKPYIFGARNGIYIIDLQKTVDLFDHAYHFIAEKVAMGEKILFVGTKNQAAEIVEEEASRADMFYVTNRWLGGTLTNFRTIKVRIERYKYLEELSETLDEAEKQADYSRFNKKTILKLRREKDKLGKNLAGIKEMTRLPGALFILDSRKEAIAIHEANLLDIPIVSVVDTNSDPTVIDYPIPGNDDAIRAIRLFASKIADACMEGQKRFEEAVRKRSSREGIDVRRVDEMPRPVDFDTQVDFEIVAKRRVPVEDMEEAANAKAAEKAGSEAEEKPAPAQTAEPEPAGESTTEQTKDEPAKNEGE